MENMFVIDREGTDRLERFLMSDRAPDTTMMLDELDGFVTGLACSHAPVPFEEWFPEIWGGEEPAYASEAEAEEITTLVLRLFALVIALLASEDESYHPIYADDAPFSTVGGWARGFMRALAVEPDAWDPLVQERVELMMPLLAAAATVSDSEQSMELRVMMEDEQMQREIRAAIPQCVQSIYDFLAVNESAQDEPFRRELPKTGRNEPCPCGSGKKYKKCCGSRG
jgi:uncharacterized protein